MKKVFIIMEAFKKGHYPDGYVNTVYEDLEEAKKAARELKEFSKNEEYYMNWILERSLL
jgi:hypothetical protein